MNLGWLGVFLEILTRADFANIDSVKERELLEELALLSNTTVSRSRIRPKPQPASESEPSFSLSHTHMHKSLSFAKIFCVFQLEWNIVAILNFSELCNEKKFNAIIIYLICMIILPSWRTRFLGLCKLKMICCFCSQEYRKAGGNCRGENWRIRGWKWCMEKVKRSCWVINFYSFLSFLVTEHSLY